MAISKSRKRGSSDPSTLGEKDPSSRRRISSLTLRPAVTSTKRSCSARGKRNVSTASLPPSFFFPAIRNQSLTVSTKYEIILYDITTTEHRFLRYQIC